MRAAFGAAVSEHGSEQPRWFYAPAVMLRSEPAPSGRVEVGRYALTPHLWPVTPFDLATLSTRHRLHLPYELMAVFLNRCGMEFSVSAVSNDDAAESLDLLCAMLYLHGCDPFAVPFISTHSLNAYAGMNSRDSEALRVSLAMAMLANIGDHPGHPWIHCHGQGYQ